LPINKLLKRLGRLSLNPLSIVLEIQSIALNTLVACF
jgi:hypothetical protein